MDLVNDVPLIVGHVGESLVTKDTGIVDDNIDTAPGVDSCLHNGLAILDISLVTDGLTTELLDLLYDIIGVDEIVDNDLRAELGQLQRVNAAKTSTATSNNGDLALEVRLLTLGIGRKLAGLLEKLESISGALRVLRLREVDDILPLCSDGARCESLISLQVNTIGSLPSQFSNVTSTRFEYTTSLGVRFVCKDSNERDDPLRLKLLEDIGRHDSLGHSAGCDRGDDVAKDVVLQALLCESLGETDEGKFGSFTIVSTRSWLRYSSPRTRIVRLTKRTKQAGSRSSANESAVLLFPEVRPCSSCALVCAQDVNLVDQVPVCLFHVLEADIAQDTSIVDENIDPPKGIDRSLDDVLSVLNGVIVGNRLTACGFDFLDDFVCSLWV